MSRLPFLLPILALLGSSIVANAADRDIRVKFPQGASSVFLEGRVKGYDVVRYDLDAEAGQTMYVDFYGTESTCNFVVHAPDGRRSLTNCMSRANSGSSSRLRVLTGSSPE